MFGRLGAPEILLILVVVLLLFGAKRLPDMARSFGQSLRILRSETKAMRADDGDEAASPAPAPALATGDGTPHAASEAVAADAPHRR
ncbi:Sec-independent protein translocase subunit TatA [Actinacidiphila glaucinigra]|uniref:Sec-independent protein translocase protein TatA n=1 Tax=Actinacidiphila glaucinigra TaxID=235986 RepID=A0A239N161_9ACTN|nr:Sec-independent protein translocase subunit TatA [Actinacidiphila glaucinigra]SNT48134.1 sec-independent protein translocase protein TatA [Actinacidiphila glaucinigra]